MFIKDPFPPSLFEGKLTKFRRSVVNYGGFEVRINKIKRSEKPKFGDVRDYTAVGDVYVVEGENVEKVHCTFNLGWVLTPRQK